MSGFEVVGVVLAVLPLCISAAEHYKQGSGAIWRVLHRKKVLRQYKEELLQQRTLLTCYLQALVGATSLPPDLQEKLVEKPNGLAWQRRDVALEMERRLGTAKEAFFNSLEQIVTILLELFGIENAGSFDLPIGLHRLKSIALGPDRSFPSDALASAELVRLVLRQIQFSFVNPAENTTILAIRKCNANLKGLLDALGMAETYHKKQEFRTVHVAYGVRDDAQFLLSALGCCCQCQDPVEKILRLRMRPHICIPDAQEGGASICCYSMKGAIFARCPCMFRNRSESAQNTAVSRRTCLRNLVSDAESDARNNRSRRTVQIVLPQASNLHDRSTCDAIDDMCTFVQSIHTSDEKPAVFLDRQQKIWRTESIASRHVPKESEQIGLDQCLGKLQPFSQKTWLHREKAVLSVILAHALLQLHESPWMTGNWRAKDIVFMEGLASRNFALHGFKLDRPYLSTRLTAHEPLRITSSRQSQQQQNDHRPWLLAFGVILLELYLNRPIAESIDTIKPVAFQHLSEVSDNIDMKPGYLNALKFCLLPAPDPNSGRYSFTDPGFRERYYQDVVLPLEDNLDSNFMVDSQFWKTLY